jgi:hypothetical protein
MQGGAEAGAWARGAISAYWEGNFVAQGQGYVLACGRFHKTHMQAMKGGGERQYSVPKFQEMLSTSIEFSSSKKRNILLFYLSKTEWL